MQKHEKMHSKKEKIHNFGFIKVKPTLNNIFITITDFKGNVLVTTHSGILKFRGEKKKTPWVGTQVIQSAINTLKKLNVHIKVFILEFRGFIKKSLNKNIVKKLESMNIHNVMYINRLNIRAHNGLRTKKKRRL